MNVLIVENNPNIRSKLQDIITSVGASFVQTAEDVKKCQFLCSVHHFDLIIIDVLLPDNVHGINLIKQLKVNQNECDLWLTSSIIKQNNNFEEDNIIDLFLTKPLKENLIKKKFIELKHKKQKKTDNLFSTFYKEDIDENQWISLLENKPSIDNHELALLYCLCSLSKFTGHIYLKYKSNNQASLSFFKGELVSIEIPHKRSYFGVLTYEYGFSEIKNIKKYLKDNTESRIGEKLIKSGCISPHAVQLILKEQSRIRMSQLLDPCENIQIKIQKESSIADSQHSLDLQELRYILAHTLWSKLDKNWIENFLSLKNNITLYKTKHQDLSYTDIPWIKQCQKILSLIDNTKSLNDIIEQALKKYSFNKREIFFFIYYLLICKYIFMKENNIQTVDKKNSSTKIIQFEKKIKKEDYFCFLNISKSAHDNEIKDRITEMIRIFHPDRYIHNTSPELVQSCNKIISHLNKIKETLLDPFKKKQYVHDMEKITKEDYLQIVSEYNKAKQYLNKQQYVLALSILEKIKDQKNTPSDTILYYCWAFMKSRESFNAIKNESDKMLVSMNHVSLEIKHSYLYHFVKALYLIKLNYLHQAQNELKICLTMNPMFVMARIELENLNNSKKGLIEKIFKSG